METLELENIDPLVKRLEPEEQKVIVTLLNNLLRLFPNQEAAHQLKEPNDTFYGLNLAGFKELNINKLRRLVTPLRSTFRSYEITQDQKTNTVAVLITFYRSKLAGQRPLGHESKTDGLQFQNIKESLKEMTLTETEQTITAQLAQQFCFVERYSSGNITATVQDQGDYYEIIFGNVKRIASGFIASYMYNFRDLDLEMMVTNIPFEVYVRVFRQAPKEAPKKRGREERDDRDYANKKQK